jgi:hypothetical protein
MFQQDQNHCFQKIQENLKIPSIVKKMDHFPQK